MALINLKKNILILKIHDELKVNFNSTFKILKLKKITYLSFYLKDENYDK